MCFEDDDGLRSRLLRPVEVAADGRDIEYLRPRRRVPELAAHRDRRRVRQAAQELSLHVGQREEHRGLAEVIGGIAAYPDHGQVVGTEAKPVAYVVSEHLVDHDLPGMARPAAPAYRRRTETARCRAEDVDVLAFQRLPRLHER